MKPFALSGFMGTGKSSLGMALSNHYGYSFVDLDLFIESKEKQSVFDIFNHNGESHFRHLERNALLEILNHASSPDVIALGGGTLYHHTDILNDQNKYRIVNLICSYETSLQRIQNTPRPLLNDQFAELYQKRMTFQFPYDYTLNTNCFSISEAIDQLNEWCQS